MATGCTRACLVAALAAAAAVSWGGRAANAEDVTITVWSHEADEPAKVGVPREPPRRTSRKGPSGRPRQDHLVREGWALCGPQDRAAGRPRPGRLLSRAGPDRVHHQRLHHPARRSGELEQRSTTGRARSGPTTARPGLCREEAYTNEIYYNKDMLAEAGRRRCRKTGSSSQAQFLDLVKKATAAGITPIAQGVGDRPYPGAYILAGGPAAQARRRRLRQAARRQALVRGPARRRGLQVGQGAGRRRRLSQELHDLKLGKSHYYFYQKPGALMLPMGSWYTGRAFVPVEKGGQPRRLPARHHAVPGHGRRRLQRMQDAGDRRELRHQRRQQASQESRRRSERHGDAGDGQDVARDDLSADRGQDRRRLSSAAPTPPISPS